MGVYSLPTWFLLWFWTAYIQNPILPCLAERANPFHVVERISRRGLAALTKSYHALHVYQGPVKDASSHSGKTIEVAVKTLRKKIKLPKFEGLVVDKKKLQTGGFYYGITQKTFEAATRPLENRRLSVRDSMMEALEELRIMRQEMEKMRKEMERIKRKMIADGELEDEDVGKKAAIAKRRRQREFDKLAIEIERWAHKVLYEEGEEDGWVEVACNKMMKKTINSSDRTVTFLKVSVAKRYLDCE